AAGAPADVVDIGNRQLVDLLVVLGAAARMEKGRLPLQRQVEEVGPGAADRPDLVGLARPEQRREAGYTALSRHLVDEIGPGQAVLGPGPGMVVDGHEEWPPLQEPGGDRVPRQRVQDL